VIAVMPAAAQVPFYARYRPLVNDASLGLLAQSSTRSVIDLSGTWRCRIDNATDDVPVRVPSSYTGEHRMVYSRDFTVGDTLVRQAHFLFTALSIAQACEVRINGQFIGKHAGETSFSLKIGPGIIRAGRNTIRIDCNNILNAGETVPSSAQPWSRRNCGGIVHDIAIAANGPVWVQETSTTCTVSGEGRAATLSYQALLNSGSVRSLAKDATHAGTGLGTFTVEHFIEVIDQSTGIAVVRSEPCAVAIDPDRLVRVALSVTIPAARLWSPAYPATYLVRQLTYRAGVLLDESFTQIGFRSMAVARNRLLLNGAELPVKGVVYMEDSPQHGRSMTMDEYERDVLMIKNLGVSVVRIPYGTVHPYFLTLCDRYGLLVFLDVPACRVPSSTLRLPAYRATARNTFREMVSRDANHPCVAAFGAASGIDGGTPGFAEYIADVFRTRDSWGGQLAYATFRRLPASVDDLGLSLVGIDLPTGGAEQVDAFLDRVGVPPDAALFVSSVQYAVEAGNFNGYSDPRSVDAQAHFMLDVARRLAKHDLAGVVYHCFADYASDLPLMSVDPVQQFTATCGITDAFRQKRLAYDVLKAVFNVEKPPVLVSGSYSEEHPVTFVIVGILLILVFAIVYNLFRRFRENVVRAFLRPFNFFTDVRDQRMLSLFQTSSIGVIGSVSAGLVAANMLYFWREAPAFDALLYQFFRPVWLKQWMNFAAWNPVWNILVTAVIIFLLLLVYTLLLRLLAFLMKRPILLFDAYSVAMWSVLPVAMLAPVGMLLYRIMAAPAIEFASILLAAGFLLWVVSRLLKGTSIVLDVRHLYFSIAGYTLLAGALLFWLLRLDAGHELFGQLRYLFSIWSYTAGLTS
jgi:beta-galactosidase